MTECAIHPDEQLALKRRRLELLRKKLELVKRDGLAFYKPHPKQEAFHLAGVTHNRRLLRAGNRFGKTEMGAAEDVAWLRGERVWLPEGHPARRGGIPQRPVKGVVLAADWDKVKSLWTGDDGKIWRFLSPEMVKQKTKNQSGAIANIVLKNGSRLTFDTVKSYMSNPMGAESDDWDFVHVDEPCPQEMYTAHARGLVDRRGHAWFTLTPLREAWINDMFFPEDEPQGEKMWAETGTIYDNPYLTREAIEEYSKLLSDEEKECRLLGIPMHLAGLVYKEFSKQRHVLTKPPEGWRDWITPPPHWPVAVLIDPHPQTPHCVLFVAVSPLGQRIYFYDIFKHCSIEELTRMIREVTDPLFLVSVRMDPLGFVNDPITETNMATEMAKYGLYPDKATKALMQGILKVQGELKKENNIYFAPTAKRTLWEIARYAWDEEENKPVDENDHAMENLYRAELLELKWVDRKPARPVREIPIINELGREFERTGSLYTV